jgi:MFS family permease
MLSARIGMYRAGFVGLIFVALGSAMGAASDGYIQLLFSRLFEGLGFVIVAVTMPGLINHVSTASTRALAMGIWGAFIPAAMSLMLWTSPPIIQYAGWQGLWWWVAAISLIWAAVFWRTFAKTALPRASTFPALSATKTLLHANPLLLVATFTCYSTLFASVTAFLPTFWIADGGIAAATAARIAAIAVTGNIAGNIFAAVLIGRGHSLPLLLCSAIILGGLCAASVFAGLFTFSTQVIMAFGFTFFAGLLPGATFASLGKISPTPSAIPLLTGMIFQGAGIGQVLGPIGISAMVSYGSSWSYAALFILLVTLTGAVLSACIRNPQD